MSQPKLPSRAGSLALTWCNIVQQPFGPTAPVPPPAALCMRRAGGPLHARLHSHDEGPEPAVVEGPWAVLGDAQLLRVAGALDGAVLALRHAFLNTLDNILCHHCRGHTAWKRGRRMCAAPQHKNHRPQHSTTSWMEPCAGRVCSTAGSCGARGAILPSSAPILHSGGTARVARLPAASERRQVVCGDAHWQEANEPACVDGPPRYANQEPAFSLTAPFRLMMSPAPGLASRSRENMVTAKRSPRPPATLIGLHQPLIRAGPLGSGLPVPCSVAHP